jgi:hypothetical protein
MDKLKSRKLWTMVAYIVVIVANSQLGLGLSDEAIAGMTAVVAAYLVGQGIADRTL